MNQEMSKKNMLDFVAESPAAIAANVKNRRELTGKLVDRYVDGGYQNIRIVACGSSSNGASCAKQFLKTVLHCDVQIVTPLTFLSCDHQLSETDFVFVVSQSGYSTNSIDALKLLRSMGRTAIGLTGDLNSDFKEYADILIDYGVGVETVGYVTKGVTTLALFLMLFGLGAAFRKGLVGEKEKNQYLDCFEKVPEIHKMVQEKTAEYYETYYKEFTSMTNAYLCSVGSNMGTAMEGALKIGETVKVPTACYEAEEYIHGPNLQLTPAYTIFLIEGGVATDRIYGIFQATRIVTDKVFLLTNHGQSDGKGVLYFPFEMDELITPLCFLPFFQILAHRVTEDLNRWRQHPLCTRMEKEASSKSANYINSPLKLSGY